MKACLMKVNYDPKYVSPGAKRTNPMERRASLSFPSIPKTRLSFTKQIYAAKALRSDVKSQQDISERLHRVHHSAPDFVFRTMKGVESERSLDKSYKWITNENTKVKNGSSDSKQVNDEEAVHKGIRLKQGNKQKDAPSKPQISVKLEPLRESSLSNKSPEYGHINHTVNNNEEGTKLTPYSERIQQRNFTQTNFPIFNMKSKANYIAHNNDAQYRHDKANMPEIHRSKTLPSGERIKFRSVAMIEMERRAKIEAQKAIREKKIFSIIGPYPSLRMALRRRGWVEKFHNSPSPAELENRKKTSPSQSTDEHYDDYDKQNKVKRKEKPWEEENGYYGLMSYLVRNSTPTFVFTVKTADVNSRVTKSNQLVNHYNKAKHFTTKSGLCLNLRSVIWYEKTDPYTFYPRSYKTDDPEEKTAFIDDYRWTACLSFVKSFAERYKNPSNIPHIAGEPSHPGARHPRLPVISVESLELAIQQLEKFLQCCGHKDIDDLNDTLLTESEWQQFISSYYLFVHEGCDLSAVNPAMVQNCQQLLEKVKANWPQYEIDGVRNVWILKPGALSRGRGIQCLDGFDEILKAIESSDNSLVIQKYIERPLLIYETKFDIRQWFLVTDWNPLTVWIYQDNYLRFCSREYTLQDFNPVIHLSNNSITKNAPNGPRSGKLPEDNTWTSDEFVEYLSEHGKAHLWKEKVMPGIKNAIICSLLCTQELIEGRKSAFELYGADFMLTEDFQPWLLEINVSPSMAQTTHATSVLVDRVLEDMIKVVLDRRFDRGSSTGRFELAFKQQQIHDPPPLDQNLIVHGRRVRNKYNRSAVNKHAKSPAPKQEKHRTKSPSEKG